MVRLFDCAAEQIDLVGADGARQLATGNHIRKCLPAADGLIARETIYRLGLRCGHQSIAAINSYGNIGQGSPEQEGE